MRRAEQNKLSALQSRSPSRKSGAKVAARHPRPALLHGSARRKATGEHFSPGIGAVDRERDCKKRLKPTRYLYVNSRMLHSMGQSGLNYG